MKGKKRKRNFKKLRILKKLKGHENDPKILQKVFHELEGDDEDDTERKLQ